MGATQADFGFVGPAYTAADPFQDRQVLVNYYLEIDKTQGAKTPTALLGCPGLVEVASAYSFEGNFIITERGDYQVTEDGAYQVWV